MATRVLVDVVPAKGGAGTSRRVEVFCGAGEQVLRWLCFAALTRTAYELGDNPGVRPPVPPLAPAPAPLGEPPRPAGFHAFPPLPVAASGSDASPRGPAPAATRSGAVGTVQWSGLQAARMKPPARHSL